VPKASHAYDAAEALIEAYRRAEAPKDGKAILAQLADVRFKVRGARWMMMGGLPR
jgi:hypothetical protein